MQRGYARLAALGVLIALALIMGMCLASLPASGAGAGPDVYDCSGQLRDWSWLRSHYGNVNLVQASGPRFALVRVECQQGPALLKVRLLSAAGQPQTGQPVALSWPGIDCSRPDPNIKPIDPAYKTRLSGCGITQRTDGSGYTGFGLSTDWYYRQGEAPGLVWVLSPSLPSDGITGVGMLGGTEHEGPLSLVFAEVTQQPTPTPTVQPPTPTPTAFVSPLPTPTPGPGTSPDLRETNDLLRQILAVLERLAGHLGAQP